MSKKLVAFFSCTGTTKKVAENLAKAIGSDLYEILPTKLYTNADLNWTDKTSRSSLEMNDKNSRPEIATKVSNMEDYDTIFIGFPIWWYVAPKIINTFLESYDFSGKKIIVFCTSGGSGLGNTVANLEQSISSNTEIIEGKRFGANTSIQELKEWANKF